MRDLATKSGAARAGVILAAAAILALLAYEVAQGTMRTFAIGVLAATIVPLAYISLERPLMFPFGLFVMLAPFEDILSVGSVGTVNKLIGIATFGAVVFALIRRGQFVKWSPAVLVWGALLVWMGFSGFWAIDPANWQTQYLTIAQDFLLYAVVAMMIATPRDIEVLCTCSVVGGLAASAVALWPLITGGTILTAGARISLPAANVHHQSDPNIFAASLLLPFAIAFTSTLSSRSIGPIVGNAAGLTLIALTIVLSGSRGAMLAIAVLTLFMLFANYRRRLLGAILLFVGFIAVLPFSFDIQNRWGNAISSGGAGREQIWQVAILAFKDHWLLGYGYGGFQAAFDRFVLQAPLSAYVSWHRAPHDILIQTGVDLGIVGLLLVAAAFFMQFRDLLVPKTGGFLDELRIALQATVIGTCVAALFLDFLDRKFLWVLFIMIALVRSTAIAAVRAQRMRRSAVCVTTSSPMPAQILGPMRSNGSSSRLKTAG